MLSLLSSKVRIILNWQTCTKKNHRFVTGVNLVYMCVVSYQVLGLFSVTWAIGHPYLRFDRDVAQEVIVKIIAMSKVAATNLFFILWIFCSYNGNR
jgi:hypothetical protein